MAVPTRRKLKSILERVSAADRFGFFKQPVTRRVAPDYFNFIKHPMDFRTIRQKLDKGAYGDEFAFKRDMDLVFSNCELYNGTVTDVGKAGLVVKREWMKHWANSGLEDGAPAGLASARVNELKRPLPGTAKPAAAPRLSKVQKTEQRPPPPPPPAGAPFPEARTNLLMEWIGSDECGEAGQTAVLDFLQTTLGLQLPCDADGEVELDPEALPAAALWQLDSFCKQQAKGLYDPDRGAGGNAPPRGPVLQAAGDDDESTDDEMG